MGIDDRQSQQPMQRQEGQLPAQQQEAQLPTLWVVVPCYNEERVLPLTAPRFLEQLASLVDTGRASAQSRILFVNDGSLDDTWRIICDLAVRDRRICGISLSRNRGHQNALLAGLMEARGRCDATISVDCDGQDDIGVMQQMMDCYLDGYEIVYGVRSDRTSDSFFKRKTAEWFYRFMENMGVESVYNHADFRLMGSDALDALSEYGEVNLFLRGMVPLLGFESTTVSYTRSSRVAGESHYALSDMMRLAINGVTNLSARPIHLISVLGMIVGLCGLVGLVWALVTYALGNNVSGWTSTICIVMFMGGIQLIGLGVVGEYVGKMYLEVKRRPRYVVAERTYAPRRRRGRQQEQQEQQEQQGN